MDFEQFKRGMIRYASIKVSSTTPDFKNNDVAGFWFNALKGIQGERLESAMNKLLESTHFPSISAIKDECGLSELNEDQIAREFIPKLIGFVERFGYTNEPQARQAVGEHHWPIVEAIGGWQHLCRLDYEEFGYAQAQWREAAKVALKRQKQITSNKLSLVSGREPPAGYLKN